jgi:hypothetical protein
MDGNRNRLLWIFGGLSMATVAIALGVSSIQGTASMVPAVQSVPPASVSALPSAPPALSDAAALPAAPAMPESVPATAPATAAALDQAVLVAAQQAPSNQIWSCTTNGVKTFSNNPCGERSTLLEFAPINTMESTRVAIARAYPPDSRSAPNYANQDAPQSTDDSSAAYGVVGGVPYYVHRPPIHVSPSQHSRGPQPRKY